MKFSIALLGVVLVAALVAPAYASHPTRLCIDAGPDHPAPTEDDDIVDTLDVRLGTSDANHPPQPGCFTDQAGPAGTEMHIDVEFTGVGDPDDSNTPESPDTSCTIPPDSQSCAINPPSSEGDQTIRVWVDNDNTDSTVEADLSEGFDEEAEPGDGSEPDFTDVSLWSWEETGPAQCEDGVDNDDDNLRDYPDDPDCESPDDNDESKAEPPTDIRYRTTITIKRDSEESVEFSGLIYSQAKRCRDGREIAVMKKQPGRDRFIAKTKSQHGRWSAPKPNRLEGRVYARAKPTHFIRRDGAFARCAANESPPITVR